MRIVLIVMVSVLALVIVLMMIMVRDAVPDDCDGTTGTTSCGVGDCGCVVRCGGGPAS